MSTITYTSTLSTARTGYEQALELLQTANGGKEAVGSIAHQVDAIDTNRAELAKELKTKFVQFMSSQVEAFKTVEKAKDQGLKAIELVKNALATCTQYKSTPESMLALKTHMHAIGFAPFQVDSFGKKHENTQAAAKEYPFAAQIATLTTEVEKVTVQLEVLKGALDKAFFDKKDVEGKTTYADMLPTLRGFPYLEAELAPKVVEAASVVSEVAAAAVPAEKEAV
jgi:hypothetical protein